MTSCCCCAVLREELALLQEELATEELATGQETRQLKRDIKSFFKELFRKVMQPIPEKCKANSFFREKFMVLADHGRWLAKILAKGSASDRPR